MLKAVREEVAHGHLVPVTLLCDATHTDHGKAFPNLADSTILCIPIDEQGTAASCQGEFQPI